jgi:hypothetical protein
MVRGDTNNNKAQMRLFDFVLGSITFAHLQHIKNFASCQAENKRSHKKFQYRLIASGVLVAGERIQSVHKNNLQLDKKIVIIIRPFY